MTGPTSAAHGAARSDASTWRCSRRRAAACCARGMGYRELRRRRACLNVAADHLGLRGIDTLEELAEVKRIVVEVARDTAVLNADDPLCLRDGRLHEGGARLLRDDEPDARAGEGAHPRPAAARWCSRRASTAQHDHALRRGAHIPLLWTHSDPRDARGPGARTTSRTPCSPRRWPTAWASSSTTSATACAPSTPTSSRRPGRMNVFDEHPFKVILDYGHNPPRSQAMVDLVRAPRRRRAGGSSSWPRPAIAATRTSARSAASPPVTSTSTSAAGTTAAAAARTARCRASCATRCSEPACAEAQIEIVPDESEAVERALAVAGHGDLVLFFGDNVARCWKQITEFVPGREASSEGSTGAAGAAPAAPPRPAPPEFSYEGELIRDERGVRLAREQDD